MWARVFFNALLGTSGQVAHVPSLCKHQASMRIRRYSPLLASLFLASLITVALWAEALVLRPTMHFVVPNHIAMAQIEASTVRGALWHETTNQSAIDSLVSAVDTDLAAPPTRAHLTGCGSALWGNGVLVKFWARASRSRMGKLRPVGPSVLIGAGVCGSVFVSGPSSRSVRVPRSALWSLGVDLPRQVRYRYWTPAVDVGDVYAVARGMTGQFCSGDGEGC